MYQLRGLGVDPSCLSFWSYLGSPSCWSYALPTWQAMAKSEATGPAAPTQAQLDAVASGQLTADQLTQQLANQQAQAQQQSNASQVVPVTDVYSVVGSALSNTDTSGNLCSQTILAGWCNSTIYWGLGITAGVLVLLMFAGRGRR